MATRRQCMAMAGCGFAASMFGGLGGVFSAAAKPAPRPNVLLVFADQWRAQATGYGGNADVKTPRLDALAKQSVVYSTAVSNCPVCSPFRASLMTGQYPLTHGVFLNDLQLNTRATSFAQALAAAGYTTGYIGKWHLDGNGRSAYIPSARRQGFDYWKVLECTHNYNRSAYYAGNDRTKKFWPGYDAIAQTADAAAYLSRRAKDRKPFALCVSWGSPHNPYRTAPKKFLAPYDAADLTLRKNVPAKAAKAARNSLAGYYAHITALDGCVGTLLDTLKSTGLDRNTIVIFTSDHGDMLYSHGMQRKQKPWDESIRIPFVLRCPSDWGVKPKTIAAPIGAPDFMPTILGLCGVGVPATCEGENYAAEVRDSKPAPADRAVLILCPSPFGEWARRRGGVEYRGVRTVRYTYVRNLDGPWMLFDNQADPFQQTNLVNTPVAAKLQAKLDAQLQTLLTKTGDEFLPAPALLKRAGYRVGKNETVGYSNSAQHGQVSVYCRTPRE